MSAGDGELEGELSAPSILQRSVQKTMRRISVQLWGLAVVSQDIALSPVLHPLLERTADGEVVQIPALLRAALLREVDAAERAFAIQDAPLKSYLYRPSQLSYFVRRMEGTEDSEEVSFAATSKDSIVL